ARLVVAGPVRDEARQRLASAGRNEGRTLVALHVGGGWPTKRWPVAHARVLGGRLAARGAPGVLGGGGAGGERGAGVAAAGPRSPRSTAPERAWRTPWPSSLLRRRRWGWTPGSRTPAWRWAFPRCCSSDRTTPRRWSQWPTRDW